MSKKCSTPTAPKPQRKFALGGEIGIGSAISRLGLTVTPDANGSDFDAINAEKTARWAAEDATKQGVRRPATGYQASSGIQNQSLLPTAPGSAPSLANSLAQPNAVETTFQQDIDARQSRISAYADKLKNMEAAARTDPNTLHAAYADGGKVETADELMARMTAKYGAPAAGPVTQQPVAQPAQPPVQQPQPKPQQGPGSGIVGVLKGRQQQFDDAERKAVGYRNGKSPEGRHSGAAMAAMGITLGQGGKISGPGTPTSDDIHAKVRETGEPIKVSTQERILSKAQDDFIGEVARAAGFDSIDAFLEAGTGRPVGPTLKAGKRAAATGMAPAQDQRPEALGIDERIAAAIAAPPTLGGAPLARSEPVGGGLAKAAQAASYRPEINGITWTGKGFDPTKQEMAPGTGAIAITSGPNAGKNIAIGPQNYTATDGTPTSDWSKTAQYAQGVAQAQKDRETLATMQRDRLERDAFSPEITDPQITISARQQLERMDAKAAREGEAYGRMLDNQTKLAKLHSDGQMSALQSQYLAETDPGRREALADRIRGVTGKGTAPGPVNLQHVETDGGAMVFNPRTGRMTPAVGADGAPVGNGKPLTEFQGKSTSFGMRADAASRVIDTVGQGGKAQPSLLKRAVEAVPLVGEGLGMAANALQSPEQQMVEQGQRDFINAVLRQESGAAISAGEFDNARKQYFPQPGDSAEVVAQKRANRDAAINGFRISAGPGARHIGNVPAQQQPHAQPAAAPKVGTVDGNHVFLGGNPADPASWAEVR